MNWDAHELARFRLTTAAWPEELLTAVGHALRSGRAVEPIVEGDDGYYPSMTYDDCIGIHYRPIDVPVGNVRVQATPRRIGVREVAHYANPSCRRCHGIGWWSVKRTVPAGVDERDCKVMQDLVYEQSCGCAERRYTRDHGRFIVDQQLGEWIALDNLEITDA